MTAPDPSRPPEAGPGADRSSWDGGGPGSTPGSDAHLGVPRAVQPGAVHPGAGQPGLVQAGPGGPGPHEPGPGGPPPGPPPDQRGPRTSSRTWLWAALAVVAAVVLVRTHKLTEQEVILFCVLVPSLILHEVAHGLVALACGDDTAQRAGRLSLNPARHVDPLGTIIVPAITVLAGFGFFGWAKPVPVNLSRLRSPRNQGVLVALAGPATNAVLAALAAVAFRLSGAAAHWPLAGLPPVWVLALFYFGFINVWVGAFNMIPIPPLDGSVLVERMLPRSLWPGYLRARHYALPVLFIGIIALSWVHVYPTQPLVDRLETWWANLLGV